MPAHFTVVKVAGDRELSDQEVFDAIEKQMTSLAGGRLEISVKATEEQIDKAMNILMMRVAGYEIWRINRGLPI